MKQQSGSEGIHIENAFNNSSGIAVGRGAQVGGLFEPRAVPPSQPGPLSSEAQSSPLSSSPSGARPLIMLFSHQDRPWLDRLRTHLALLAQQGLIALWDDSQIAAGADWQNAMAYSIAHSRFALLLVSANFLASPLIASYQLPLIHQRVAQEQLTLLPLLLSPCLYKESPLGNYQPCNPDLSLAQLSFAEQEEVLVNVARTIYQALY